MKIAIVSDTHFGYKWGSEREDDPFDNAREAFERTADADLVILPGDIFDKKVPKQEVLGRAVDCFNVYKQGDCDLEIVEGSDVTHDFDGTPVVAIHGTHERRTKGFTNPIELLEKMSYLLHLHNERVVFEADGSGPSSGEKVAVHGMSGVPERFAPRVLEKFAPEPVPDAYNIFVFHQSVKNLVYTPPDHDVLTMEHLPDGFDLLVDGHIHWRQFLLDSDRPLVLPGSTIATQMNKVEAETPKGYVTVDTETGDVDFHELDAPRDLHYEEIDVSGMSSAEIMDAVADRMSNIPGGDKKPLVRLVLAGETAATVTGREIRETHEDDAVLSVSLRLDRGRESSATLEHSERSVAEMGRELLREKVDGGLATDELFDLLAEGDTDAAVDLVEEMDVEEPDDDEEAEDTDGDAGEEGEENQGRTLADF